MPEWIPEWLVSIKAGELAIDVLLLLLVVTMAASIVAVQSLFAATMLTGIYSLMMALVWVNLAAMDVAFTEAAVGAGISTVLYLGALSQVGMQEKHVPKLNWPAFFVVLATGSVLVYGTIDMPRFGNPNSPAHRHLAPELIQQSVEKLSPVPGVAERSAGTNKFVYLYPPIEGGDSDPSSNPKNKNPKSHVPNMVTAVLAGYRSFDTMFETAVIFTAGATMILLLRRRREQKPILSQNSQRGHP